MSELFDAVAADLPEDFRNLHHELGIENPDRLGEPRTEFYVHYEVPEVDSSLPGKVERVMVNFFEEAVRYWIERPGEQPLDVFHISPDLETALVYDPNDDGLSGYFDGVWLYHSGDTFYRVLDDGDAYFVPAPKPEITDNWSNVRDSLRDRF